MTTITRDDVVAEARKLIGTPFRHLGRCPGAGIDCLGVIGEVGLALNVDGSAGWLNDPELRVYGRTPRPDRLIQLCNVYLDRIAIRAAGLGDILLMAFSLFPQHFAIISQESPRKVIHAYPLPPVDRVVENGVDIAGAKVIRAYRFRGVEP